MRIGHGYDVHRLVSGRDLILGGVKIPYALGLDGHSDADVLLHAVMDALLGAAALRDIGYHFPDTDPTYKGADSMKLLEVVGQKLTAAGYRVGNIDVTMRIHSSDDSKHCPGAGHSGGTGERQGNHRRKAGLYRQRRGHELPRSLLAGGDIRAAPFWAEPKILPGKMNSSNFIE